MTPEKQRYEIKFVLNEVSMSTALDWLSVHTDLYEKYSGRHVNSLYFDDLHFSAVKDNLVGISERQKNRLRWYCNEGEVTGLSFECKIKNNRSNYKRKLFLQDRRVLDYSLDELSEFLDRTLLEEMPEGSFIRSYNTPTLHVEYYRQYFEDSIGLRLTFDRQISFKNIILYKKLDELCSIPYPPIIMELKFPVEIKDYASRLLKKFPVTPVRHSKYLAGLATFGLVSYI